MIYNSVIISFVLTLLQKLRTAYDESIAAKIINFLLSGTKKLLINSKILNFFARRDFLSKVWEYSGIYKLLDWTFNVVPYALRKLYLRFEGTFSESLIIRFLQSIVRRFEILAASVLTIIIVVPHEPWSDVYSVILVAFLAVMYSIKIILQKYEGFNLKAIDFMLFAFIILVFFSIVFSFYTITGFRFLLFYITCFLLVLTIVSSIKTERALGLFLDIFLVGVTITGLYGIWQAKVVGVPVNPAFTDITTNSNAAGRIFSTVGNPNNYAEILLLTLPFYMSAVLNAKTVLKKIIYVLLAIPPLLSLVWTGARMSWIAFAAAVFVYTLFKNKKLIPLLILAGVVCIPMLPQSVMRRLMSINFSSDTSILYRFQIYETVLPMLKDYWLTGVGLGTDAFMKVCEGYYLFTKKVPPHAHNLFLQIWLEVGLVGIIAFVWFIVRMIKKCITNICIKADKYINNILVAGISSMTGVLLMGLSEYIWYYPRVMIVFWTVVAVMLAGLSIANTRREGLSQKNM